jgi:hypothetical protein
MILKNKNNNLYLLIHVVCFYNLLFTRLRNFLNVLAGMRQALEEDTDTWEACNRDLGQ